MSSSSSCKRPSPNSQLLQKYKRLKIVSGLASIPGQGKTALAHVLNDLNHKGLLTDPLHSGESFTSYRRQVQSAVEDRPLYTDTPYGRIIQELELPTGDNCGMQQKRDILHYANPFALLYYLASLHECFYSLMCRAASQTQGKLRICLYIDGINPGNPLHPDPQKLLQGIYWTFLDFPTWFLRRKDSWFVFCLTRELLVKKLPGYVSEFMKLVLHIFFGSEAPSFQNGFVLQHREDSMLFTASFEGFMADEKALKELFDITGQAGNVPCPLSCLNVRNRWVDTSAGGLQKHWDPDLSRRIRTTDSHVKKMVDRLARATPGVRQTMQTRLGINYNPRGMMFDDWLMNTVLSAPRNYIRD